MQDKVTKLSKSYKQIKKLIKSNHIVKLPNFNDNLKYISMYSWIFYFQWKLEIY